MVITLVLTALIAQVEALPQEPAAVVARPRLVTADTRADEDALAALETPGKLLFRDDFETAGSLAKYFEVRGRDDGRAVVIDDEELAHRGHGALQLTAPARDGAASGAGVSGWLGDAGHECLHLRYWLKFADDYDQGDLNHTGGGIVGVGGRNKWAGMGTAGIKPKGDDHFSASFETWIDWRRAAAPGWGFVYTYWMDMERDRDGHHWGNMLGPVAAERVIPERGRWHCYEIMVKANTIDAFDGELATWIDGRLYTHWQGIRWRSAPAVQLKRFGLDIYIHHARQQNRVWYDDVALSTGYLGPTAVADPPSTKR